MAGRRGAALAILLLVTGAITWFAVGHSSDSAVPRTGCPTHYGGKGNRLWVPARPPGGSMADRVAPDEVPRRVQVCSYPDSGGRRLARTATLRGPLDTVASSVAELPGWGAARTYTCIQVLGRQPTSTSYLLRLTYPDGEVWASTSSDSCTAGTTNGRFGSRLSIAADAAAALETDTWPAPAKAPAHCPTTTPSGRLGDDHALVPGTPTTVTVCRWTRTTPSETGTATAAALTHLLDAQPASPPTAADTCRTMLGGEQPWYELTFRYRLGPDVRVRVRTDCGDLTTDMLQARIPAGLIPMLDAVVAHH